MKVIHVPAEQQNDHRVYFHCPGCDCLHAFNPYQWEFFNWDMDKPTVRASIMVNKDLPTQCHSYITDGFIRFEPDTKNHLTGQNIELPELNEEDLAHF